MPKNYLIRVYISPIKVSIMPDIPIGKHVIAEFSGCQFDILNDKKALTDFAEQAAIKCGATVLNTFSHQFEPQGVTVNLTLSESHLALHSFPEFGYISVDIYTCGDVCNPYIALEYLKEMIKPKIVKHKFDSRSYTEVLDNG